MKVFKMFSGLTGLDLYLTFKHDLAVTEISAKTSLSFMIFIIKESPKLAKKRQKLFKIQSFVDCALMKEPL